MTCWRRQIIANIAAVSAVVSQSSQIPRTPLPPAIPVPPPAVLNLPAYRRTLSLCSEGQVWFCSNLDIDVHRAAHMEATAAKKREGRSNSKGRGSRNVHASKLGTSAVKHRHHLHWLRRGLSVRPPSVPLPRYAGPVALSEPALLPGHGQQRRHAVALQEERERREQRPNLREDAWRVDGGS